ncbi:hypothetical protein GCM10010458_19690 [Microbacterium luteolum]
MRWAGADDATGLSREQLIAVETAIGVVQRTADAVHADVAARIAYESRAELGAGSLAKEHGFRSAAKLIAATTGVSSGDASRLVKVGEATAPRTDLLGARLPARYEVLRAALAAGVIPWVMGGRSEILDWGREKRLFTRAQRLALVERDGGCAMCGLPPGMTKAHHIRWWTRDNGPTDLSNGVLLCETCHHRIHDNGWEVRIDGTGVAARVWFIPPAHVDPARTPRTGGRHRFDIAA